MKTVWDNVEYFEDLIAEYAGSKYAAAVDSCSNGIFLCAKYLAQDVVVNIPCRTYISVPMQIIHAGYNINFTETDWTGAYRLDPLPIVDSAQRFTENMYTHDSLHCVSFHSKKILSIGRGGMILTDDKEARDWFRRSRYDGRTSIYYNDMKYNKKAGVMHGAPTLGWHMYMTTEQAVRGIEQFYRLPKINKDNGGSDDYEVDLSELDCFKPYIKHANGK